MIGDLPYDVHRCIGVRDPLCENCRRREPGSESHQSYIAPAWEDGRCRNHIAPASVIFGLSDAE